MPPPFVPQGRLKHRSPVAQTFHSAVSPAFLSAARQHLQGASNRPASAGWKACETADREVCARYVPKGQLMTANSLNRGYRVMIPSKTAKNLKLQSKWFYYKHFSMRRRGY